MTRRIVALLLVELLAGCARRTPRLPFGDGLDAFLRAHEPDAGQNIRADEIGRTETASYHVVQVRRGESPHRHTGHDLAVFVLRGHGTLTLGSARIPLAAGDGAVVPRGVVHWFTNEGRVCAVALVAFTPPLDAPDMVPVDVR